VELQNNYGAFQEAGVEVIALAVSPVDSVGGLQQSLGVTYPMLSDADHQVSESYGVYNLLGDGLAAPSVFIIDVDGRVVWHYVGADAYDRLGGASILNHLP
jgi:peroxiredoxin Q/BCP